MLMFCLRTSLAALTLLVFVPVVSSAEVTPREVFAEVERLNRGVERVRFHMGAPKITPLNLRIRDAQPHDVYFLALKLVEKSNRLLFQVTRKNSPIPDSNSEVYRPADVLKLIGAARQNVADVLAALELPAEEKTVAESGQEKQPSDVFLAILALNRQINTLLNRRFAPSDVYEEVTLAIGYSAILLSQYPDVRRLPRPKPVEPGRMPSDVFFSLLSGLEKIAELYSAEGLSSLAVNAEETRPEQIIPGDVFDIASLVVARLDFLHKKRSLDRLPRKSYYPGNVYPTDVYRQVGVLLSQLDSLLARR